MYAPHRVAISSDQAKRLMEGGSVQLGPRQLGEGGTHDVFLTKRQLAKLLKAKSLHKATRIRYSPSQLHHHQRKVGGSLFGERKRSQPDFKAFWKLDLEPALDATVAGQQGMGVGGRQRGGFLPAALAPAAISAATVLGSKAWDYINSTKGQALAGKLANKVASKAETALGLDPDTLPRADEGKKSTTKCKPCKPCKCKKDKKKKGRTKGGNLFDTIGDTFAHKIPWDKVGENALTYGPIAAGAVLSNGMTLANGNLGPHLGKIQQDQAVQEAVDQYEQQLKILKAKQAIAERYLGQQQIGSGIGRMRRIMPKRARKRRVGGSGIALPGYPRGGGIGLPGY